MNPLIKKIQEDIRDIIYDWKSVCNNHSLLKDTVFLEKMHTHIILLEEHSTHLKKHKHIYDLLDHILHTPAGAPIVSDKTLFDCAKTYDASEKEDSALYQYLNKSLTSSEETSNFLFNSLSILDEKIIKAA
jgi:hypothetical protein